MVCAFYAHQGSNPCGTPCNSCLQIGLGFKLNMVIDMKKYDYVKGLAELSQQFDKNETAVYMKDFGALIGNCDYCNAKLRYKYFFVNKSNKNEIGIGVCCAMTLSKYINMPEEFVKKAIKFFTYYQNLCRKTKTQPEAIIELKELDKYISKLKKLKEEIKQKEKIRRKELYNQNIDKIKFILARSSWLNEWERSFINDAYNLQFLTDKMVNVLNKIFNKVKDVSDEEIKEQHELFTKLQYAIFDITIPEKVREIFNDIYKRGRALTPRQKELLNKWYKMEG